MIKTSVIIPVNNDSKNIIKSINSVIEQTLINEIEIIIITDNIENTNEDLLKKIKINNEDKKIKIIKNKNIVGFNQCRNIGINEADGEYVCFLEDNDIWYPSKIEKQINALKNYKNSILVFSDVSIYDEYNRFKCNNFNNWKFLKKALNKEKEQSIKNLFSFLLKENFIATSSVLVKRDKLLKTNLFNPETPLSKSWDLWLNLSLQGRFVLLNEPLLRTTNKLSYTSNTQSVDNNLFYILNKYKHKCSKKTYTIARSNIYAFIANSLMKTNNKMEAISLYIKALKEYFQFNILKNLIGDLAKYNKKPTPETK